jgi:hypothetical protein
MKLKTTDHKNLKEVAIILEAYLNSNSKGREPHELPWYVQFCDLVNRAGEEKEADLEREFFNDEDCNQHFVYEVLQGNVTVVVDGPFESENIATKRRLQLIESINEKFHWHAITFFGFSDKSVPQSYGYTEIGSKEKQLTQEQIQEKKVLTGMSPQSVITNCSYLGYMSKETFLIDKPVIEE